MSMGEGLYQAGAMMEPTYNGIIKTCAFTIATPAIVLGLSVQLLAAKIYMNQCNPGTLFKTAGSWALLSEKNMEAADNLAAEVDSVNDDNWSGDDAEAFKASARGIIAQLKELAITALLIAAQLIALGVALSVYWLFLLACTGIMVFFLGAYLVACWTGVGEIAAKASAWTMAASLITTAESFEAAIRPIMIACTALTGTLTIFTWGFQIGAGNKANPLDIAGASIANMLEGFGTFWARKALMPSGMFSQGLPLDNAWQAFSTVAPVYQGGNPFESDNWNGGFDGGGSGAGIADGAANLWESVAPDVFSNPEEVQWS